MVWTDKTTALLRRLWDEGLPTAEIGRRMGISKNAVVGRAHRLNLDARQSPIKRGGMLPPRRARPRRAGLATLAPLGSVAALPPPVAAMPPDPPPADAPVAKRAPPPRAKAAPAASLCCWPIGEPGTRSFRFCDMDALAGKSYCAEHMSLAFVRVRDRREDHAR